MLENTIIVYTSDHGDMAGEHGLWWKRTYYDGSARVPMIITGPGLPAGERVSSPVELVDLFPTFCSWAGCGTPDGLDGEDLSCLLDPQRRSQRRKRLARSELLGESPSTQFRMIRDERWKLVDFPEAPARLFDLQNDPGECHDLASARPPEAPMEELMKSLHMGMDWSEIESKRQMDRERAKPLRGGARSRSTIQYRLPDGCIIPGDGQLYR
jgi:choline-sulfatase